MSKGKTPKDRTGPPNDVRAIKGGRVFVPINVLKALTWGTTARGARVMADLAGVESVVIRPVERVKPRIERLREDILSEPTSEAQLQALAVLADRYRELSLYDEQRLQLTDAVLSHLGLRTDDGDQVFVQALGDALEIMSLAQRETRLRLYQARTDVSESGDLHLT